MMMQMMLLPLTALHTVLCMVAEVGGTEE